SPVRPAASTTRPRTSAPSRTAAWAWHPSTTSRMMSPPSSARRSTPSHRRSSTARSSSSPRPRPRAPEPRHERGPRPEGGDRVPCPTPHGRAARPAPTAASAVKLELRGITKTFGSFVANDAIDLVVEPGEIHSLLGENGAGKSTLMNVLYGLYRPDGGQILLDDRPVSFSDPGDAMAAGIGMVHQHFMLVPVFTVAENMVLGNEPTRGGLLDLAAARKLVREISARFGFDLDPV